MESVEMFWTRKSGGRKQFKTIQALFLCYRIYVVLT